MNGKYRNRTMLRGHLPRQLAVLVPKGPDCGAHEWYRQDNESWGCYHCKVITDVEPWSLIDAVQFKLAALQTTIDLSRFRPLTSDEVATVRRLAREANGAIRAIAGRLDTGGSTKSLEEAFGEVTAPAAERESELSA